MTSFFVVATLILLSMNAYIGWRLIPTSELARPWRIVAWSCMAILAFGPPILFFIGRVRGGPFLGIASSVGWVLFGIIIVLLPVVVFRDIVGAGILLAWRTRGRPVDPERRLFLARSLNVGALTVAGTALGFGFAGAMRRAKVERVTIPIQDLPDAFVGYRIAQLTDTHVSPMVKRPDMEAVVGIVNGLGADMIAFTGDLVDGYVEHRGDDVAPIADLSAPDGVYFVTGNHEYYWDLDGWLAEVRRHGLIVLENEHRVITRDGHRLVVGGVPDISVNGTRFPGVSDPALALEGAPEDAVAKILLAHQPRSCFAAEQAGFDFQLCGHTHGGQIFPWTVLIHLVQPFVRGLGKLNDMQVYVNPGSIYWGPPLRLGSPAEVTLFTLTRA